MHLRFIIVYAIGLAILATGCEKKARLNLPYEGDKIVLNAFIQADSPVYIRVTKSEPVVSDNDTEFTALSHAQVTMLENGLPFSAVHWREINGRGYFVSDTAARPGKVYTITAAVAGLTAVTGTDSIPGLPEASGLFAQQTASQVKFMLKDPAGTANYYRVHLYAADSINGSIQPLSMIRYRMDPSLNDNFGDIISDTYYQDLVVKDERFDGKTIRFVLQTDKPVTYKYLVAEVTALTTQGYRYLKSVDEQQNGQDDGNFLSQPVKVYSNVTNGYGIVAGMYTQRMACKVTK
jgi:hypothetical protein